MLYGKIFNNQNVLLTSILIGLAGLLLSCATLWCGNMLEMDAGKAYEKALKFSEENAEEFPYAVKTQQGGLYAVGKLHSENLISNEHLDGNYLAVLTGTEKYTEHVEYYECGHTDSEGRYHSKTCTRHWWSWDEVSRDLQTVDSVTLLGQEISKDVLPWYLLNFERTTTNEGKRYYYIHGHLRLYFNVVYDEAKLAAGFTSNSDGFAYDPKIIPSDGAVLAIRIAKWFLTLLIFGASIACAIFAYRENYEEEDIWCY